MNYCLLYLLEQLTMVTCWTKIAEAQCQILTNSVLLAMSSSDFLSHQISTNQKPSAKQQYISLTANQHQQTATASWQIRTMDSWQKLFPWVADKSCIKLIISHTKYDPPLEKVSSVHHKYYWKLGTDTKCAFSSCGYKRTEDCYFVFLHLSHSTLGTSFLSLLILEENPQVLLKVRNGY